MVLLWVYKLEKMPGHDGNQTYMTFGKSVQCLLTKFFKFTSSLSSDIHNVCLKKKEFEEIILKIT